MKNTNNNSLNSLCLSKMIHYTTMAYNGRIPALKMLKRIIQATDISYPLFVTMVEKKPSIKGLKVCTVVFDQPGICFVVQNVLQNPVQFLLPYDCNQDCFYDCNPVSCVFFNIKVIYYFSFQCFQIQTNKFHCLATQL